MKRLEEFSSLEAMSIRTVHRSHRWTGRLTLVVGESSVLGELSAAGRL